MSTRSHHDLTVGPSFNGLAITARPLISSFVHRNLRNAKEDDISFCAQVILMKHQADQMQWDTIAVPQAKETRNLLQMLIYEERETTRPSFGRRSEPRTRKKGGNNPPIRRSS